MNVQDVREKKKAALTLPDKETLELLGIPGFLEECEEGLNEISSGGGKTLHRVTEYEKGT